MTTTNSAPRIGALVRNLGWRLGAVAIVVSSMGASCTPRVGNPFDFGGPSAPVVLGPTATAADVVAAINANTSRVQTYSAPNATIATPDSAGLPVVDASIAVERPKRFRLRATTAFMGPEVDLGSNEDRFWIWARRSEPPALYTARHDQWATSPARSQMPIEPSWLIDALGLTHLDSGATYVGPTPKGDGMVELAAQINTPSGTQRRVLLVDARTAQVREQHLYDPSGVLMASVLADRFRYDGVTGVSLPERVRVQAPGAGLELTINTGPVTLNAPLGDPAGLWTPPQLPGTPIVDVSGGGQPLAAGSAAWDFNGSQSTYPAAPITRHSGPPPETTAGAAPEGFWSLPAAGASAAPTAPTGSTPFAAQPQNATLPAITPIERPATAAGFVGLPSGGRALPAPR